MRAIGVIRVSQVRGREGASFASPVEQRERIETACERDGLRLLATHEELDVSGGTPLAKRPGLLNAVEAVEAGGAEVVIVAYFDRLVRSLAVQAEVVERVEQAGGRVVAVDVGQITGATATQWLQGTVLGTMSEYYRRSAKERSGEAQARAVARGVCPFPSIPPGYDRDEEGPLVPNAEAPAVAEAFELRTTGETIAAVRAFLAEQGIPRSYRGAQAMLCSRLYLGEIHFGKLVNLEAHPPIVDRDVWRAVQGARVLRGRRAKSDRLLARLGVLRCGSCGARMVVGTQTSKGRRYPFYRCPPTGDCSERMTISAQTAEAEVVAEVKRRYGDVKGRASAAQRARDAAVVAERDQANLDAALRAFRGLEEEPAAIERLAELRAIRDASGAEAEQLSGHLPGITVDVHDMETWPLERQRRVIKASGVRAFVGAGRGADRISFEPFGQ